MFGIIIVALVVSAIFYIIYNNKKQLALAKINIETSKKYLEENAKNPNVKSLSSGLQYEILKEAEGPKPNMNSNVTTHYEGKLTNGTVFDSSLKRNQAASFPLNGVIKGWQEGIQLMSVGAKYRFFIPAELAYGMSAVGSIPGGSLLIFEVELLDFK